MTLLIGVSTNKAGRNINPIDPAGAPSGPWLVASITALVNTEINKPNAALVPMAW